MPKEGGDVRLIRGEPTLKRRGMTHLASHGSFWRDMSHVTPNESRDMTQK